MTEAINVVRFRQPDDVDDPLTEMLRVGARRLLAQAVEFEAEAFLASREGLRLPDGRARLVRHGHGPEREVQTGMPCWPTRASSCHQSSTGLSRCAWGMTAATCSAKFLWDGPPLTLRRKLHQEQRRGR